MVVVADGPRLISLEDLPDHVEAPRGDYDFDPYVFAEQIDDMFRPGWPEEPRRVEPVPQTVSARIADGFRRVKERKHR